MASLVRPVRVRHHDAATGKRVKAGTPGATTERIVDDRWHAKNVRGFPKGKLIPLSTNLDCAQKKLAELIVQGERRLAGLETAEIVAAGVPLTKHLEDYVADLRARATSAKQIDQVLVRLRAVVAGCQWRTTADIAETSLRQYLAKRMQGRTDLPAFNERKSRWTREELAAMLRIKPASVQQYQYRHRLAVVMVDGLATISSADAERLYESVRQGDSPQTANHYLTTTKGFCNWLVSVKRLSDNPLRHMKGWKVALDTRHARGTKSFEEIQCLLTSVQSSTRPFRGLAPADRFMLYATALGTGFRARELAALKPESFRLTGSTPAVTLPAKRSKNRKPTVQQIPASLADSLQEYLAGKATGEPLWPGAWSSRAADMLKADLHEAGIPYVVHGEDGPLHFDFHALRGEFCFFLDAAGLTLKQAMQLMRHSDPRLTMRTYGRLREQELSAAVNKLPNVLSLPALPPALPSPPSPTASGGGQGAACGTGDAKDREIAELRALVAKLQSQTPEPPPAKQG